MLNFHRRRRQQVLRLGAATHAILDTRQADARVWIMDMPGFEVLAEDAPYALVSWTPGAADPHWPTMATVRLSNPPTFHPRLPPGQRQVVGIPFHEPRADAATAAAVPRVHLGGR